MAHELTIRRDGKAEMAFVGETPWHGLGQTVTKGASLGVWAKEAGMDWDAKEAVPFFQAGGDDFKAAGDHKVIYRSDTKDVLSIMSSDYQIHQPRELLEFFREMIEDGGWHIHTAGTLKGGRKLWVMATADDKSAFVGGKTDPIVNNLLVATSMDGSMKTTACLTPIRVVCANTVALALNRYNKMVRVSHRSTLDSRVIRQALGIAQDQFRAFMLQAAEMADTPIKLDEARDILTTIFKPAAQVKKGEEKKADLSWLLPNLADLGKNLEEDEPQDSRSVGRVLELFSGDAMGASLKTSKGTRWGLFNAITQHVDHEMGRTADTRIDSAWFGRGNGFKLQALNLLAPPELVD